MSEQKTMSPTMSENQTALPNIHQRILGIMGELAYIQKEKKMVNGQYTFVSHDQVAEKIHEMLVKYRVTAIPSTEEITQNGNRTEVKLIVCFVNADCPTDFLTVRFPGYGIDSGDKGPGKAISYAYKYVMLKTFVLKTGDDPDKDQNVIHEPEKCLEFDSMIPLDFTQKDINHMNKFLQERAKALKASVEDIKREAVKRMPDFLTALKKWDSKKKEDTNG